MKCFNYDGLPSADPSVPARFAVRNGTRGGHSNFSSELLANWKRSDRLLSVREVQKITGLSHWTIYEDCKKGILVPCRFRKPYRFSAIAILKAYYAEPEIPKVDDNRSLKNKELEISQGHNPMKREDLWS